MYHGIWKTFSIFSYILSLVIIALELLLVLLLVHFALMESIAFLKFVTAF